jgi:hypothetical protein
MDGIAEFLGINGEQLTQIVTLGVVLLILLVVGRVALKLTATLFKVGCFPILLSVGAVYLINLLSG